MQNKRATKSPKKTAPPAPTVDQRSFELVLTRPTRLLSLVVENIISAANRALHREAIQDVRVERLRCTDTGHILGIISPTSTLQALLKHRDLVLKPARTVLGDASDLVPSRSGGGSRSTTSPSCVTWGRQSVACVCSERSLRRKTTG